MGGILKVGKKTIHSDYFLMIIHKENDGRILLAFADRHSADQFRIYLEAEEQEKIYKGLIKKEDKKTDL